MFFRGRHAANIGRAAIDAALLSLSLLCAYALRFNFAIPDSHLRLIPSTLAATVLLELAFLAALGCHRTIWRLFSAQDIPRLLLALAVPSAVMLACRAVFGGCAQRLYTPISVNLMNFALSLCAVAGVRWLFRTIADPRVAAPPESKCAVIAGTGPASLAIAYSLRNEVPPQRRVAGFIVESESSVGSNIQGLPVLAAIEGGANLPRDVRIDEIVVPQGAFGRSGMRRLLDLARSAGARMQVAPGYSSVLGAAAAESGLRFADITDVLKRGTVSAGDIASHRKFLEGRSVMVTGAGGSIGSEISRQALAAGASRLILVERGELALFNISGELESLPHSTAIVRHIADVGDRERMARIVAADRPEIVFHAAAYKHVALSEENVCEAVRNNVFGTIALAEVCAAAGVGTFVLLSSDKAVEPSSAMGATKRVCEIAVMGMNGGVTKFTAVRFGNVLGSTGSVVPIFREQILRGGPVTVTHPDMERFFMTIPEAASLTLVAAAMAGDKPGRAFVLDMGEPVRISDLAEDMIRLAGKVPGRDVAVVFTGAHQGEKLREILISRGETAEATANPHISCFQVAGAGDSARLAAFLGALKARVASGDDAAAHSLLMSFAAGESYR